MCVCPGFATNQLHNSDKAFVPSGVLFPHLQAKGPAKACGSCPNLMPGVHLQAHLVNTVVPSGPLERQTHLSRNSDGPGPDHRP